MKVREGHEPCTYRLKSSIRPIVATTCPLTLSTHTIAFLRLITIFQMISLVVSQRSKKRYSGILERSFWLFRSRKSPTLIQICCRFHSLRMSLKSSRKSIPQNRFSWSRTLIHRLRWVSVRCLKAVASFQCRKTALCLRQLSQMSDLIGTLEQTSVDDSLAILSRYRRMSLKLMMDIIMRESTSSTRMRWIFSRIIVSTMYDSLAYFTTDFRRMQLLPPWAQKLSQLIISPSDFLAI